MAFWQVDNAARPAIRAQMVIFGPEIGQPEVAAGAVGFNGEAFATIQNEMRPAFTGRTHGQVVFVLDIDIQKLPLEINDFSFYLRVICGQLGVIQLQNGERRLDG